MLTTDLKLILIRVAVGLFFLGIILILLNIDSFNPNSGPLYDLKRFQEKTYLNLKKDNISKLNYLNKLLTLRLNEINYLVSSKNNSYLWQSSLRYSTTAGEITELIVKNNLKDSKEETITRFQSDKQVFEKLYIEYPKNTSDLEYKYLEDAINYLNIYINQLRDLK